MLPVAKRKTLEIPHGLAAVAAAICLVLAFASDFRKDESARHANATDSSAVEIIASRSEDQAADQAGNRLGERKAGSESARQSINQPSEGSSMRWLFTLLPLHDKGGR